MVYAYLDYLGVYFTIESVGKMEVLYTALLSVSAFCLGACPFSVWIGRYLLGKDIGEYGDGNPGAANVFRAGGHKSGYLAVILDVAKGVPFVVLAHSLFGLPEAAVATVALCAILGHAFSPLLKFKGGKSIAVTFGVLLAMPQHDMLIVFALGMFLGFLFIEIHAWAVMLGPVGSSAYLIASGGSFWQLFFMLGVLIIFAVKHFDELHTVPRLRERLVHWLQSRKREI